jgi:hypothetical protein
MPTAFAPKTSEAEPATNSVRSGARAKAEALPAPLQFIAKPSENRSAT